MKAYVKGSLNLLTICAGYFFCTEIFAAVQATNSIVPPKETLLSLTMKGGPVMVLLGLFSLVGLAVAIERWISLSSKKIAPKNFFKTITEDGKEKDLNIIKDRCLKNNSALAKILISGIDKWQRTKRIETTERYIEDTASKYVSKYKRSIRPLMHIGVLSPLLGLLGTIIGLINAFQSLVAIEQYGKIQKMAGGIYEVMVCTAAGMLIAIPALIIYYYLIARLESCSERIEEDCNTFLDDYIYTNK